jgi:hypothetical protein
MTAPKLTDEMRQALAVCPTGPIRIEDAQTQNFYALLPKDEYCHLNDEYIRRELQISIDQAARGEISELNMDELLAEAHRRYAARNNKRQP